MSSFDKREEGFEKKFAHDEELRFRARARRDKMLGLWAAEKLGLSGDAAESYAKELVASEIDAPGEDGVFQKIRKDFNVKAVGQSDHQIRRMMEELMTTAVAQLKAE